MHCSIAIAYNHPVGVSETFIQQHVENIAPGRTLGLVFGSEPSDIPLVEQVGLGNNRNSMSFLARKMLGMARLLRTGSKLSPDRLGDDRAVAMLRRHGCKTILAEYGPNGCAVRHIAKRAGARLFVHFHGYDASSLLRLRGMKREYAGLFRQAVGIITPSRFLADRLEEIGCPGRLLHVVPCGVDTKRFRPVEKSRFDKRVVAIGRLTPKKAPLITIRAFAKVCKAHPDAHLDMVGDGPLAQECRELVAKLGMEERITLHGPVPHDRVLELMASADLFVQHSVTAPDGDTESFGIALVEAMACGIPVVVTRHNGFGETIEDGQTGYLVEEHDIEAMAVRISELLSNPQLCRQMGKAGRTRAVELFDKNKSISKLQKILGLV